MKTSVKTGIVIGCVAAAFGTGYYLRHDKHIEKPVPFTEYDENAFVHLPDTEHPPHTPPKNKGWWESLFRNQDTQHLYLLKQAQSNDLRVRLHAVEALGYLRSLTDAEYRTIAKQCDLRTCVGLARTGAADKRYFLPPPLVAEEHAQGHLQDHLRLLLSRLPETDEESCINFFTHNALQTEVQFFDIHHEKEEAQRFRHPSPGEAEMHCLQAMLSHTDIPEHRHLLVDHGALQLLHRVRREHPSDLELHSLVAQMVANMALDSSLHARLFQSGWVSVLAKWIRSSEVLISLPAARALANMDSDSMWSTKYEDGIYLLHPHFRTKEKSLSADIIFVHGLMGSVFKTWRQHDSQNPSVLTKLEDFVEPRITAVRSSACKITVDDKSPRAKAMAKYTNIWPKNWLAKDLPNTRILALDYDTYLSQWMPNCPLEPHRRTLVSRGKEMLDKLKNCGVGDRPVIWICHSMGGLLVKQILTIASELPQYEKVAQQTAGVVFYATPHRGADLADLNTTFRLLLLPSVELQELRKDCPKLLELDNKFRDLVKKYNIPCLSFGETAKTLLGFRVSKVLVPRDSSDPGFGDFFLMNTTHLDICKPQKWSSYSYQLLLDFLDHVFTAINHRTYMENIATNPSAAAKLRQLELYMEAGVIQF
ncbi:protein SERAC1-like [Ornithodoros turicata]|uniref:Protein SERAC1 n=1 Tax=Ornithodoros turicata TaxID=34597 RepID=A0A2R5LCV5_9ACAR